MPRKPRVFVDGAIYHVYCRFAHGARVFAAPEEAERFLAIVREVKRTDGFSILAWCLMPTHYHLALRTGRLPLWRSLRLIQGRFALAHNRRHKTVGPLWQGRYQARLVEGQEGLNRLLAYIHLNPVKAGLAASPLRYRWSGHRELLGRVGATLLDVDATLQLYGTSRGEALRAYAAMVRAVGREAWAVEEPGRLPWWRRGVGAEEFGGSAPRPAVDAAGASTAPEPLRASLEDVLAVVEGTTGVTRERLGSGVRDRATVAARELLAIVAVHRCGVRVTDVGRWVGRPADTVSRWLSRGAKRRLAEATFDRQVDAIEAELRRNT
ncbi:MAG: transposase [Thermoanaerobaculaceae bacterium]|nr:transposase [Thermoanaerobaculaceae bacterium]